MPVPSRSLLPGRDTALASLVSLVRFCPARPALTTQCSDMVLLVSGSQLAAAPVSPAELYQLEPELLVGAEQLAAKRPLQLDPAGLLYVRQKQWAATHPGDRLLDGERIMS